MVQLFLKITFRNKVSAYAALNIAGLAMSVAPFLLLKQFVIKKHFSVGIHCFFNGLPVG